LIFAINMVRLR